MKEKTFKDMLPLSDEQRILLESDNHKLNCGNCFLRIFNNGSGGPCGDLVDGMDGGWVCKDVKAEAIRLDDEFREEQTMSDKNKKQDTRDEALERRGHMALRELKSGAAVEYRDSTYGGEPCLAMNVDSRRVGGQYKIVKFPYHVPRPIQAGNLVGYNNGVFEVKKIDSNGDLVDNYGCSYTPIKCTPTGYRVENGEVVKIEE